MEDEMTIMSKSPVINSFVFIRFKILSSSFNKKRAIYKFRLSFIAYYAILTPFIIGLLALFSTHNSSPLQVGGGLICVGISIFLWFYLRRKTSYFDLFNRKFYPYGEEPYDFDEIYGIQLLEYIDARGTSEDSNRLVFQMNLVLKGIAHNRICLLEGSNISSMRGELQKLSEAIQKPSFDQTETQPQSKSSFWIRFLIISIFIFFMFYISVGRMMFHDMFPPFLNHLFDSFMRFLAEF